MQSQKGSTPGGKKPEVKKTPEVKKMPGTPDVRQAPRPELAKAQKPKK